MKQHLVLELLILMFCLNAKAQRNTFIGNWQFFDKDSVYHELTISGKYIYIYEDSSEVIRQKSKVIKTSLYFGREIWTLKRKNKESIDIQSNIKGKLRLYKLYNFDDELVDFYDWVKEPERNGNGVMIYWGESTGRKNSLLERIENGL